MSFYPVMLDWEGMPCLIAGGGKIALHKTEVLCSNGADVTVVAPEICEEIRKLPVRLVERPVTANDLDGMRFAVDATGSSEAQEMLSSECRLRKIPFNSACRVDDGTAMFPAVSRSGKTVLAVSTIGASPAASAYLRDELAGHIPDEIDGILDVMAELRPLSREHIAMQSDRRLFLRRCLSLMLRERRKLADSEITEILQDFKK